MVRILVLALALLCAVPLAHAGAGDAEYYRLRIELDKLASRNAWKGVDRMYNKMLKLDAQLAATDPLLGAQAASNRGATLLSLERLELAAVLSSDDPSEVVAQQAAASQLDGLVARYGKVELSVGAAQVAGHRARQSSAHHCLGWSRTATHPRTHDRKYAPRRGTLRVPYRTAGPIGRTRRPASAWIDPAASTPR